MTKRGDEKETPLRQRKLAIFIFKRYSKMERERRYCWCVGQRRGGGAKVL